MRAKLYILSLYFTSLLTVIVLACSPNDIADCDVGHVLYKGDDRDYCLSYDPDTNSKLVLCIYPNELCSQWVAIPSENNMIIQLMLKGQGQLISTGLTMTHTGENIEMKLQDADVSYDKFKAQGVTLNLKGKNCWGIGDEINGLVHIYEVVEMSHFGMVNMQFVPVCPEDTKHKWTFQISNNVQELTACDENPCENDAQCINNDDGTRTCDCSSTYDYINLNGYHGENCETACILGCRKPKRDNIFRRCHMTDTERNGSKILCGQKPRRRDCRTDCKPEDNCKPVVCSNPTPCDRKRCKNGGECTIIDDDTKTCNCAVTYNYKTLRGYTGDRCETECDLGCLKLARNNTFRKCSSHLNIEDLDGSKLLCGKDTLKWKCKSDCQEDCLPIACQVPEN